MMVALTMMAANTNTPVLGVDAAPTLKRWVSELKGLNVTQVPIEAHGARVDCRGLQNFQHFHLLLR